MSKNEYYKINSEVKAQELANFNLFRKLSHSGGRPVYVQFHRRGAPLGASIPSQIYIHADEIEAMLKAVPNARINQRKLPCGKIAFMLMTNLYRKKVLENPELDFRAKIEITVHCFNEALRFIQSSPLSSKDTCDSLRLISTNLVSFTYCILVDDETRGCLVVEVFNRNKNHLSHAVRVCLYTCFTTAVINYLKSVTFEPNLISDSILGILLHDEHIWQGSFIKQLEKEEALISPEVRELASHLKIAYEKDYCDERPATPLMRIATITDAFDELTACNHSHYVFGHLDAFVYLKQRLTDKLYKPYLELFMRAFCGSGCETVVKAG